MGRRAGLLPWGCGRSSEGLAWLLSLAIHSVLLGSLNVATGLATNRGDRPERLLGGAGSVEVVVLSGRGPRVPRVKPAQEVKREVQDGNPIPGGGRALGARLIGSATPRYPLQSRRAGEEGEVAVRLRIEADGTVVEAWLERSSGHFRLDSAALEFFREARFEVSGAVEKTVSVVFRLEDQEFAR